jgi:hypothetical protein
LALVSGVGGAKLGRGYKVGMVSEGCAQFTIIDRDGYVIDRTREGNQRIYILDIAQLVDGSTRQTLLNVHQS